MIFNNDPTSGNSGYLSVPLDALGDAVHVCVWRARALLEAQSNGCL